MVFTQHRQRILSGLVLLSLLCVSIWLGNVIIKILVALIATIALSEFYQMRYPQNSALTRKAIFLILGLAVLLAPSLNWAAVFIGLSFLVAALSFLFDFGSGNIEAKLSEQALFPLGIMYIPVILSLAFPLNRLEQVFVILVAITSDVSAYYIGLRFGKHKIWPMVSPKKSWEGSTASLVSCVVICVLFGYISRFIPFFTLPEMPLWGWALSGILLNCASQLGDFFESALKRSAGIKDSGILLPGHGGILDRIDGILFILPTYTSIKVLISLLPVATATPAA